MSTPVNITRVRAGVTTESEDKVVDEVAVALVYNGISHAVMMCSPTNLDDFAVGFSLTEGIVQSSDQIYTLDVEADPRGWRVEMEIAGAEFAALKNRRRQLTGRSGCGLCGVDSLEQALRQPQRVIEQAVESQAIERAITQLSEHQVQGAETGASHAAAWMDLSGNLQAIREDVGRHNALDKLIGSHPEEFKDGFAVITSRASYEMVHKACSVGIGALVAVSAPTSLAVDMAHHAGLNLIGFARPGRHQRYQGFVC